MATLTRREFVHIATQGLLALSGIIGLGGIIRFLSFEPEPPPPKKFEVGSEKDFPVGSRIVLADIPAILFHDQEGLHALSLVCTHLGCTVQAQSTGLACPCHGSRFNEDGKVAKGPATSPLEALRVEVSVDGKVIVYK